MIVVEGPDGAGKTTLIASLMKFLDISVAPRVVSKDAEAMVDLKVWVEDNVRKPAHPMIYDRHRLISEPIYGPILRQAQQPGFTNTPWMMAMTTLFYGMNPVIIYCLPPLEVVKENIYGDPDNIVVCEHIEAIYAAYAARAGLDWTKHRQTIFYDYTLDGEEITSIFDHLKPIVAKWKAREPQ